MVGAGHRPCAYSNGDGGRQKEQMTKKQIKRVAKEFTDQAMNQRSEDHDEDTAEESISPVEPHQEERGNNEK